MIAWTIWIVFPKMFILSAVEPKVRVHFTSAIFEENGAEDSIRAANCAAWSLAVANVHRKFALYRSYFEPFRGKKKTPH